MNVGLTQNDRIPSTACTFSSVQIQTPLGDMFAIADKDALILLEFKESKKFEKEIKKLQKHTPFTLGTEVTAPLHQIQQELAEYFAGMLRVFKTPVRLLGTDFQQATWRALQTIPCGETRSYAEVANIAGKPGASRALGNANGANRLTIIVPCHRVIQGNGTLGGYSSGLDRKKWLLAHEGCIGFS